MESAIATAGALIASYGLNVLGGIAILIIGWLVARWAGRTTRRVLVRLPRVDAMLAGFFATLLRYAILIFTLLAVLNQFGVQTTSLIALLGATGLAIGLAVQGTLTHLAAGIMLLLFRPFRAGEWINAGGTVGRVDDVDLFTTTLISPENIKIIMPNGKIWGEVLQNYSQSPRRRVEISLGIGYGEPVDKALAIALDAARGDARILAEPAPQAFVATLADHAVQIVVRFWTDHQAHDDAKFALQRALLARMADAGIAVAPPRRIVQVSDPASAANDPDPRGGDPRGGTPRPAQVQDGGAAR